MVMTEGSEVRAIVVVLFVASAIAGAFLAISGMDVDDEVVTAPAPTVTTTSTTTTLPLTDDERLERICDRADQFLEEVAPVIGDPILLMRAGETFWTDAAALAPPDLRVEYDAALDHYVDFNDIGDPLGYDTGRILREGDGLRWEQLVTREPFAVNVGRQQIAYVCGVTLPEPYSEDPVDFAEIKEVVDRELNPERYETTTVAPPPPAPTG